MPVFTKAVAVQKCFILVNGPAFIFECQMHVRKSRMSWNLKSVWLTASCHDFYRHTPLHLRGQVTEGQMRSAYEYWAINQEFDNTSSLRQNGRHFAINTSNVCVCINRVAFWTHISLKFVPEGSINNKVLLGHVIAWHCTGIKPLSEPMTAHYTDSSLVFVKGIPGTKGQNRGKNISFDDVTMQ